MQMLPDLFLHGKLKHFLTRPNEKIVIAVRKHPIVLLIPIYSVILADIFFSIFTFYLFSVVINNKFLFFLSLPTIIILTLTFIIKNVVDWYFNLYIMTTSRLLEIKYTPLSSFDIYQVLLDQVRCTEIDIKKNGIISEFIDVGTIEFTFDRPTHQEHFYFENVQNSRNLGMMLSFQLGTVNPAQTQEKPVWYKDKTNNKFSFVEEIFNS